MYSNTQQQQRQNAHLDRLRDDLPTHESPFGTDFKPTHGGAGSLPGGRDESGVARLPDEIAQEGRGGFNNNNNIPGATQPVGTGTGQTFGAAGLPAYERTQEGGGYNDNNKLNSTIPGTKQPVSTGQTYETSRFQEIPGQRESADERIPGTYGYGKGFSSFCFC